VEFTVQHTCSKDGEKEDITSKVPFLSKYDPSKGQLPFLGEGYYFWEYNLEYAKIWGDLHYDRQYYVFESDVEIDHNVDGFYLDLAGNRKHLVGFVDLLREFELIHPEGTKGVDLCYVIKYLREACPEEVFPFKVIRAVDYKNSEKLGIKIDFTGRGKDPSFTILNPRIIISYKNKGDIIYKKPPYITFTS